MYPSESLDMSSTSGLDAAIIAVYAPPVLEYIAACDQVNNASGVNPMGVRSSRPVPAPKLSNVTRCTPHWLNKWVELTPARLSKATALTGWLVYWVMALYPPILRARPRYHRTHSPSAKYAVSKSVPSRRMPGIARNEYNVSIA